MNFIKQNDIRCIPAIREIGCFFRCCGIIAELRPEVSRQITPEDLNKTWQWAKDTKRIDAEDNVRDSASIATRFLRLLGDEKGRFIEVGLFKNGVTSYYPAYKGTKYARTDALIQKVAQNGINKTHFRVINKKGCLIEDPHEPVIQVQGVFYSILYCYDKGE